MDKLSYININGDTVFTSKYYRNRGSCCKSGCLHCPFGHTLRTVGITLSDINATNEASAKAIFKLYNGQDKVTSSLLDSAFGSKPQTAFIASDYKLMALKGFVCGLLKVKGGTYESHLLSPEFTDQGITDSYLRTLKI